MSGELNAWAKKQSPFITISVEEPFIGKYLGYKFTPSRFDTDKEVVRYLFELPDGTQKPWENGQIAVAKTFDGIAKGTWVKIIRTGEAAKTKYEVVEVTDASGNVSQKTADLITEDMSK